MKKADIKIGNIYRSKVSDKLTDVRIDAEHPSGGWDATNLVTKKKVRIKSAQRLRAPAMTGKQAKAVAAADQENARVREERAKSPDGQTKSERAMARSKTRVEVTPEAELLRFARRNKLRVDVLDGQPKTGFKSSEPAVKAARKHGAEHVVTDGKTYFAVALVPEAATPAGAAPAATSADGAKGKPKAATEAKAAKAATRAKQGGDGPKRVSLLDRAAEILAKAKEPMRCKDIVDQALADGWTTNGKTPHATLYAAMTREIATKGKDARFEKVDRGRFQSATAAKGA